jgi:triosephosphate isomerase
MKVIFINLKRFDVPKSLGGICPNKDPIEWIQSVVEDTIDSGLGNLRNVCITYLLPESLIAPAIQAKHNHRAETTTNLSIGCQGVHWQDVEQGKNFGAFTTLLPAAAAIAHGAEWTILGHSEERRAKKQILLAYDPQIDLNDTKNHFASRSINRLINQEVIAALKRGINVLLCIGETESERGEGTLEEQKPRIEEVLKDQLRSNLQSTSHMLIDRKIVIGYEPLWAIGPGKTPPIREYISFVSAFIKETVITELGIDNIPVVYGGGLKEENAEMIASIDTIDGGLVALTRFTGEIGFSVPELNQIVQKYIQ